MENIWVKFLDLWKNVEFLLANKSLKNVEKLLNGVFNLILIEDQLH
jgi:hypothetical protein